MHIYNHLCVICCLWLTFPGWKTQLRASGAFKGKREWESERERGGGRERERSNEVQ